MVGLVIVSHSHRLATGVRELAGQMAPGVPIAAAGGTGDGRLGTDAVLIQRAIEQLGHCDGVLVLMDLGSAVLSAQMALELVDDSLRDKTALADGPLVEGAVAAAVQASLGSPLAAVKEVAEQAACMKKL